MVLQKSIHALTMVAFLLMAGQMFALHVRVPQHKELTARHLSRNDRAPVRAARHEAVSPKKKHGVEAKAKVSPKSSVKESKVRGGRRAQAAVDSDDTSVRRGKLRRVTATRIVRGRRVRAEVIPYTSLRGSHDLQVLQNQQINNYNLERIQTDDELLSLETQGALVRIPETGALHVNPQLEVSRRYARPWTVEFIKDLSASYYAKFHQPIEVTSAVRTAEQQKKLMRHNGNAAPIEGDGASSHLAGTTFDIGKSGMSMSARKWVTDFLLPFTNAQLVVAIEEHRQACFHIMVSPTYAGWKLQQPGGLALR
jgi:hypothetical protein